MNECSDLYVEFRIGPEEILPTGELRERVKLLKCTRVLDEGLQDECWGAEWNAFEDPKITDDWYCCRKRKM